jgi:hypothetical protein
MAVLVIENLVSRKWLPEIVSAEETSTQVELAFTAALEAEGLLDAIEPRHNDGRVDLADDDETRPMSRMGAVGRASRYPPGDRMRCG